MFQAKDVMNLASFRLVYQDVRCRSAPDDLLKESDPVKP